MISLFISLFIFVCCVNLFVGLVICFLYLVCLNRAGIIINHLTITYLKNVNLLIGECRPIPGGFLVKTGYDYDDLV